MPQDVRDKTFQGQLAELFRRLLDEEGPEVFEIEARKAIAGISAAIYQARGPERLDAILEAVPEAVERDIAMHSKRFDYQVIPVDEAEPIHRGMVMMPEQPSIKTLRRAVEPHLDGAHLQRVKVTIDGERRDMLVDDLAIIKGASPQ